MTSNWGHDRSIFHWHSPRELTHVWESPSSSFPAAGVANVKRSSPLAIPVNGRASPGSQQQVASTWPINVRTSLDDLFERSSSSGGVFNDFNDDTMDMEIDRFPTLPNPYPGRRVSAPATMYRDKSSTFSFLPQNDEDMQDSFSANVDGFSNIAQTLPQSSIFSPTPLPIVSMSSAPMSAADASSNDDGEFTVDHMEISQSETSVASAGKLGASKSPIMEALVYCALHGWGLQLIKFDQDDIQFRVDDFKLYYEKSALICAKQNPTEAQASRIKALKRWFPDFPCKRDHETLYGTFTVQVAKATPKDNKPRKLRAIIKKMQDLLAEEKAGRAIPLGAEPA